MKRHQLESVNVRARHWLRLGGMAMLLLAFAVACGDTTPAPTPTATPTPTPTPTATPTPTPALITVGPGDNPQAFLQAIPASERDCVVQAFGSTENKRWSLVTLQLPTAHGLEPFGTGDHLLLSMRQPAPRQGPILYRMRKAIPAHV